MNSKPLEVDDFTNEVAPILDTLRTNVKQNNKEIRVSDIFDAEGNQYINLVQEGGGLLGIALVGFTYILEEMGIRFLSLGGTSAGAINTIFLADVDKPANKKSLKILEKIAGFDFMKFVDGGKRAKWLVNAIANEKKLLTYVLVAMNMPRLLRRKGINPGFFFEEWLKKELTHKRLDELEKNIRDIPDLILKDDYGKETKLDPDKLAIKLAIVAADITTQTKVEFPKMADLYLRNPKVESPAAFVRASMSIPVFFEPKQFDLSSFTGGKETFYQEKWRELADFKSSQLPKKVQMVDGGVMSNFPVDLFHTEDTIPLRPTIGIKLGIDRYNFKKSDGLFQFVGNIFDGVRNLRDHEFLKTNQEYQELVEHINIDNINWLDFALSNENQLRLFREGAVAAQNFLNRFNWTNYKKRLKSQLIQRIKPLTWELSNIDNLEGVLKVFKIEKETPLFERIQKIRNRPKPYKVLWVDNSFTYTLPMAILDKLNISCITANSSREAFDILNEQDDIDLIISDLTREDSNIGGIILCKQLILSPKTESIPVLIYVHSQSSLKERYFKHLQKTNDSKIRSINSPEELELPKNIINSKGRNTVSHKEFIMEVVENIEEDPQLKLYD